MKDLGPQEDIIEHTSATTEVKEHSGPPALIGPQFSSLTKRGATPAIPEVTFQWRHPPTEYALAPSGEGENPVIYLNSE